MSSNCYLTVTSPASCRFSVAIFIKYRKKNEAKIIQAFDTLSFPPETSESHQVCVCLYVCVSVCEPAFCLLYVCVCVCEFVVRLRCCNLFCMRLGDYYAALRGISYRCCSQLGSDQAAVAAR